MRQPFTNSTELPPEIHAGPQNGSTASKSHISSEQTINKLRLIWSRRRFLLRVAVWGLVLGILTAFVIPKRYESTTRLMPPDQSGSGMAMLSAALGGRSGGGSGSTGGIGAIAGDLLGMKTSTDLFIGILQSRTVEDDLIDKFDLRKVYRDRYYKDAREDLESKTDITADKKSGILKIRVTDKDPKRAAAMAGEYVAELDHLVTKVNTTSAHREREFLEGRLAEVNVELESAEKNFSEFASKNTALDIPTQGKAMIEAAAALKGQLIVSQMELQGMRQIYSDNNVRVRGLQARVDEIQKQMQQLGGAAGEGPDSSGQKGDPSLFPSIRRLPALGVNYADLYRNAKVQEAVYETLTQEYELAKVQEAKETPSVKVIDAPDVPEKYSFPRPSWVIIGGTLLFLLSGIAWIFGSKHWKGIDSRDPAKSFVIEIASSLKAFLPSTAANGNGAVHPSQPQPEHVKSEH
ncbi:MAG TPA: Wzz/FepE/Etk N-terminal domain-containing protein [Candidatus Acidoferrales bacterium]|nr:Wzz/FepE/Etk N-terminal domain-containing protein [Candidatus Acidoferrales bacterium]